MIKLRSFINVSSRLLSFLCVVGLAAVSLVRQVRIKPSLQRHIIASKHEKDETQTLPTDILDKIQSFMKDPFRERPLPPNTPGAFLHLGKTGGSTLSNVHQNACHSFVKKPCNLSPHHFNETKNYVGSTTTYIHVPDFHLMGKTRKPEYSNFDFYVATLRDPLLRFLSAFTFMHPANELRTIRYDRKKMMKMCGLLYTCFPSLDDFAMLLGNNPFDFYLVADPVTEGNCTNVARALVAGRIFGGCNHHFNWNTKSVLEQIPGWKSDDGNYSSSSSAVAHSSNPAPLLVIRTEDIDRDFFTANIALGDPNPARLSEIYDKKERVQDVYKVTKELSEDGRRNLCKALLPEYKVYITALSRAINLSKEDRRSSLELAQKSCPDLEWLFRDDTKKVLQNSATA